MTDEVPHETAGTNNVDPLGCLLSIGPAVGFDPAEWPDYVAAYGLRHEHVAALTAMACDPALHRGDRDDDDQSWAPVHALRALGQLAAAEAVTPVLSCLTMDWDEDVIAEEFPHVLGLIGPAAMPSIATFLSGPASTTSPVISAMEGLKKIALAHPACREASIDLLTRMLERDADPDGTINGFAIWNLIDLTATEVIDAIHAAFRRRSVDLSIVGDEEDVEIALGLRTRRTSPRPALRILPPAWLDAADADDGGWDTTMPRHVVNVGRNEPCPCGSGKKYKKCCLP